MKRLAVYAMLLSGLFAWGNKNINIIVKRIAAYAFLLLSLFACGEKDQPAPAPPALPPAQTAPQAEQSPEPATPSGETAKPAAGKHIVAKGDTLYSIAKKNGLNYREVARWNKIKDPRRLRVGQELTLTASEK